MSRVSDVLEFLANGLTPEQVFPLGDTWPEFRVALTDGWAQVTAAANWMVTELYARHPAGA